MYDDLYKEFYGEEYGEKKWYSVIPLALLVFLVPLIVYGKAMNLTGNYFKFWNGTSQSIDFFSYYKSVWIIILTVILLVVFLVQFFKKSIQIQKMSIYIPIGVYSFFVILSTIFSDYKDIAVFGFVERYEGMLVLLCYMIILFITINMVNNKSALKAVLIALLSSAVIIGLIGIFQYFGHDIFKTMGGRKLILPANLQNMASKLNFQFGDKIIYSTLYHYDYVGSYMAMLFPLTLTMLLLVKNKIYKILLIPVTILMFLNLLLCHSRAGIVGGILALIVLIIMLRKYLIKNLKLTAAVLAAVIIGGTGFNIYSKGLLSDRIGSLFKDAGELVKDSNDPVLKDVTSNGNELSIVFSDKTLKVVSQNGKLDFKDASNKTIESSLNKQNGQEILKDDKYKDFNAAVTDYSTNTEKKYGVQITRNNLKMPFLDYNDHFTFTNDKGDSVEIKQVPKCGFEGKEQLGSARGYIWSRSIPLLKHTVLVGYGPDTFAAEFPQDDYIGKLTAYGTSSMLVDKAHNIYLAVGLNTGIVSLIAFLAIMVMYFISSVKLYFKNDYEDLFPIVGLGIFTAVVGYLGAGFFNDSIVSVAPVFWTLLGIGISINAILNKKTEEKK
ncbi:O-antigen ligase family protein [Clostridium sp. JN-1]|uniref:O-antigen ligase family protein n=1 Tax=Clostridium sp. JN-1 TaxID=2483110 RepID=UPI000F0BA33D|nr:O-antigen ligase family protein [Clostridium sp. JN-1]